METNESKSAIIEKIQKLLRLATSSNQHEAELAAQRASDLMKKYRISSAVLEATQINQGIDKVMEVHYRVPDLKMKYQWVVYLGWAAAKLFDGTIFTSRTLHGTAFTFVGFESEIPLMKSMFEHLLRSWEGFIERDLAEAKTVWNRRYNDTIPWQPKHTMEFKLGHGQGYAYALLERCEKIAFTRNAEVAASGNTCTALVVVRSDAVTKYTDAVAKRSEEFCKRTGAKKYRMSQSHGSTDGKVYGANAGNSVALGGSITQGSKSTRLS